jgi:glucan phosphoethanolaminetransferase (alkaline phosphatase superfamily)
MRQIATHFPFAAIIALLTSPGIAVSLKTSGFRETSSTILSLLAAILVFLVPLPLFFRHMRFYLYLMIPLAAFTPVFLFATYYFGMHPGYELIAFMLQTNPREACEAVGPFLVYFVPFELLFVGFYVILARNSARSVPLRLALSVSAGAGIILGLAAWHLNGLQYKALRQISKWDLILKYDYPFSLLTGAAEARSFLKKNNLREAENFSFRAIKYDSLSSRQVYVLIIGESSRYDRWQINGYRRETSPHLMTLQDLLTFGDVVAGAHYTWVSVPQIITRATPENYELQYREKSILGVFQESGFRTFWLSNQSDQDIFWSGSIILHGRTADYFTFSPTYSPNLEFEDVYDGRLLTVLDSVLQADQRNLFIVMHTMGNHWEYNRRYPAEFNVFKPSTIGETESANMFDREVLTNSYDNSILYADHMIYNVIDLVRRHAEVSAVMFVSDHGEDLFDAHGDRPDFHFRPSPATLRVPLFIWTSERYSKVYPDKRMNLEAHVSKKIGTENIFYTLSDLANIRIAGFDSSKSLANGNFRPSEQKYYGDDKRAHHFAALEAKSRE